ncbi:PREDICTED: BEN domain-containing protein 5-like [Wasmannia auropunctata]|uniref:BEN domain-containing protein 5-like n=1 Tax=Wasmannia auropunctata TaxID=64793 RepID=UPI0005EE75B9|nr:PREDICTED: BEN domain-containing protein 5-like [Wasmannia auropunctata]
MKISHAQVRFFDDKKIVIVKTSAIRNFHPKNVNDFNKRNLYDVKWTDGDENDHNNGKYFMAQILFLGTSITDVQEKSNKGRLKFTKADTNEIFDDMSDVEENEEDKERKKKLKPSELAEIPPW